MTDAKPESRHPSLLGELGARLGEDRDRQVRFLGEVGAGLSGLRQAERRRRRDFFAQMSPRLASARALERELDRHLARRFNIFDYVSTDEASLSRIIADLLDPGARHGQGTLFLRTLLDELGETVGRPDLDSGFTGAVTVATERVITNLRKLDISVEISGSAGAYCLAFENKPFAPDQRRQVRDYLRFLERTYGDRFLLIYLSRAGQGPTSYSLPPQGLEKWKGRLAVMGYWRATGVADPDVPAAGDRYDDFRVALSLAEWLSACRRRCEPDRLRWFLSEAEVFCKRRFGGFSMATDSETRTMKDYLFAHPEHLETAQSVYDAWLNVKGIVCTGFLEHLCTALSKRARQDLPDIASDLRVDFKYGGEKQNANTLWLHRASWPRWQDSATNHPPHDGCTAIFMQSLWAGGPNNWYWGLRHPLDKSQMTGSDQEKRTRLEDRLRDEFKDSHVQEGGWWLYMRPVGDEMGHWNARLPDIYREWQAGGGAITDFYVDGLMDIATRSIPIIDEVEGTSR